MPDRVFLCIGTKKGLFVAESAKPRRRFDLRGPFGPGVDVYSALIDVRGAPRLYASSCSAFFGMKVLRSTDLGKTFKETKTAPAFPKGDGRAVANIWALEPGAGKKDLLAGVEPALPFSEQKVLWNEVWSSLRSNDELRPLVEDSYRESIGSLVALIEEGRGDGSIPASVDAIPAGWRLSAVADGLDSLLYLDLVDGNEVADLLKSAIDRELAA